MVNLLPFVGWIVEGWFVVDKCGLFVGRDCNRWWLRLGIGVGNEGMYTCTGWVAISGNDDGPAGYLRGCWK